MSNQHTKTVLTAINAKYIHTGLAVRSIYAYAKSQGIKNIELYEFTINESSQVLLERLYKAHGDIYLFSCYIWNIDLILNLAKNLRKLYPNSYIGLGGPQVSYSSSDILKNNPQVDFIICGEGELSVAEIITCIENKQSLENIMGVVTANTIDKSSVSPLPDLDSLCFCYPDLDSLNNKIIYYESMRGCPFSCSYCTSSIHKGVRKRSLDLVFSDLKRFIVHGVRQVKFVDRTFNYDKSHAHAIWDFLIKHDNGFTNFHFELCGELLDAKSFEILKCVRPGLFQFEIGVQSTNTKTLSEINRPADLQKLFSKIQQLMNPKNIHIHLDLIAGLPFEDFKSFEKSFNNVYSEKPHQLQLGILKILPGSKMSSNTSKYNIIHSAYAPFDVLRTNWMTFEELTTLRGIAQTVEIYYNSGRFSSIVSELIKSFKTPFDFYNTLFCQVQSVLEKGPISYIGYYDILARLMDDNEIFISDKIKWIAKYDLLLHEKPRKLPSWIDVDLSKQYRNQIRSFFGNKDNILNYLPNYASQSPARIERLTHLEVFGICPITGTNIHTAYLFDYQNRDILGHANVQMVIL